MTDAQKSYSLEGKTAFVTGAAGGIGSAITERLCGLGARVILADMVDRVESAAKEWASKGLAEPIRRYERGNSANSSTSMLRNLAESRHRLVVRPCLR